MINSRTLFAGAFLATCLTLAAGLNPAAAAESGTSAASVERAVSEAVVNSGAGGVVTDTATSVAAIETTRISGRSIKIPRDPESAVTMTTASGQNLTFGLPVTSRAEDAQVVNGTVVYSDPVAHSATAVQPLRDGAVRALVTIADRKAPKSYRFDLALPVGGGAEIMSDGSVELINSQGLTYSWIEPAWAVDANGVSVPTSYALDGSTLVQQVNFDAGSAFPVVADPTFQGDCGRVTCTIRLSRGATRNARDASWIIGAAGGACAVISAGALAAVCGAAVAPAAVVLAVFAGRYYEDGDCLGIRFPRVPVGQIAWSVRVEGRTYNCF